MKNRIRQIILLLSICGISSAQFNYTLPSNAWRVSVKQGGEVGLWKNNRGKFGGGAHYFSLDGYGKRYYDHLHPNAYYDLEHLDSLKIGNSTVGNILNDFNASSAAAAWGDTLPEFNVKFFGPDSVAIDGYLHNSKNQRTITRQIIKVEYGISNRITFTMDIPHYSMVEQIDEWDWKANTARLSDFIEYHLSAQQKFSDVESFFSSMPMDQDTLAMLLEIQQKFYSWDGSNSVLWALAGGADPLSTGIAGQAYNPFASDDTTSTTIDELIDWYHPKKRSATGLGDPTLKLAVLLAGKPVWSMQSTYSVYGGLSIKLPVAHRLSSYKKDKLDKSGRPAQFSELPLGQGSAKWTTSLFGEFYRANGNRVVSYNWLADFSFSGRGFMNFPVTFLGTNMTDPDSIISHFGEQYGYRRGWEFTGAMMINNETISDRLWIATGINIYLKGRDKFYSVDDYWINYMEYRTKDGTIVHDTEAQQATIIFKALLSNQHPLKKIGPLPFDIESGLSFPVHTRNTYSRFRLWLRISTYFQAW